MESYLFYVKCNCGINHTGSDLHTTHWNCRGISLGLWHCENPTTIHARMILLIVVQNRGFLLQYTLTLVFLSSCFRGPRDLAVTLRDYWTKILLTGEYVFLLRRSAKSGGASFEHPHPYHDWGSPNQNQVIPPKTLNSKLKK